MDGWCEMRFTAAVTSGYRKGKQAEVERQYFLIGKTNNLVLRSVENEI
jgi:hypothetical protein